MKSQKGASVLEIVIGLAISGMLLSALMAAIPAAMKWAPRQTIKLGVEEDLAFARYWLTRDANAAETFIPLSTPQYGSLQWRDFSGGSMVSYNVTYSYDTTTDSLIREERQNDVVQTSLPVARKILNPGDAQFTWSPGTRQLSISLTSAIEDAPGVGNHSRNATVVGTLRPRSEPLVSAPGDVPVPPPPPGSATYYVSGNPTIITGSLVSGNGDSLHDADTSYYVVNAGNIPGGKAVVWSAESEVMTAPTTISQLEVRFTGKVDRNNIAVEFWVKDSDAGFPAAAWSGFTFTQTGTDVTNSFYIDQAALDYINSLAQRRLTLKVQATGNATFTLSTNQVVFIASP